MNEKKFRLTAKSLFLTYPKRNLEKEEALYQLTTILSIEKYVISEEKNELEGNHIHALLELEKKVNILSPNKLDLIGKTGEKIHGNYQTVKNKKKTLAYARKGGNYITNFWLDKKGKELSLDEKLVEITKKEGYEKALEYF